MPDKPYLIHFDSIGNPVEGYITSTQVATKIPFAIKRVFWTYQTPTGYIRGNHANKCTEEVLIAITGSIKVKASMGREVEEFLLHTNSTGLFIPALCWTEIEFSENSIALCLTSTDFDENDYIHTYDEFKELTSK